jgi:hypothetical protein
MRFLGKPTFAPDTRYVDCLRGARMTKTHVRGYYRKDGTYVKGYTQNRHAGSHDGDHRPGRRALIAGMAAAAAGAWLFRGQILPESTPVVSVTRIRARRRTASIGKVHFELPEQDIELVAGEDRERQIRLLVDVTNSEMQRVTFVFHEQQLSTDEDRTYIAARGQVAMAPGRRARVTLTFVIPDTELPATISLRLGRRVVVLAVQEQRT